jgi:hypothetical protein
MAEPESEPMRIPPPYVTAFSTLAALSDLAFVRLADTLSTASPTVKLEILARAVETGAGSAAPEVTSDSWQGIVAALSSLSGIRRTLDRQPESIAAGLAASADLELAPEERETLRQRVARLLPYRSVVLLGKSVDLATEHDKVFVSSRCITDIRPVFEHEVDSVPSAALLAHVLKIQFVHAEGRYDNVYITLDDEDLEELSKTLARAAEKAKTLKQMLGDAGVSYMGPTETE